MLERNAWRDALPTHVRQGVCELDPQSVETASLKSANQTRFRCKRCGAIRPASSVPFYPCTARPKSLTRAMVLRATLGKRKAGKFFEDEERRRKKQRRTATEETREKRQAHWKEYTQREEVKASRKRRNDAYYATHREEYF